MAAMEGNYNVRRAKFALDRLDAIELKEVAQYITHLRNSKSRRSLELPPEIRNRIYRLCITPDVIEKHVLEGMAPALLKVNHQITSEFEGLYYNGDVFHIELRNPVTKVWETVKEVKVFRAMLGRWLGCGAEEERVVFEEFDVVKNFVVDFQDREHVEYIESTDPFLRGQLKWCDAPPGRVIRCQYFDKHVKNVLAGGWLVKQLPSGAMPKRCRPC